MAYCTKSDLINRAAEHNLVDVTDDAGRSAIDDEKITAAIAIADSMIDGYLRGRYTVPVASPPVILKGIALDIAYYRLRLRTGMDDETKQAYEDAKKTLIDISKGTIALSVVTAPAADSPGSGSVVVTRERVFTKELLDKRP